MAENPLSVLKSIVGKTVMVRMQDGFEAQGKLVSVDDCMNISLSDSEWIGEGGNRKRLGDLHVKGENLVLVAVSPSS